MADPSRLAAFLIGTPVALDAALLARWPELAGARFRRGGLPPRVPMWFFGSRHVAVTLWGWVFLSLAIEPSTELLLHELRHVQQFHSVRAFPLRYLWELVRRGYVDNRYEVDARAWATARLTEAGSSPPPPSHA